MELVEPIERINTILRKEYGCHDDGRPRYRVVWSDDQLEKRWTDCTKDGLRLLNKEVIERKKYQHIKERYVLEQLSIVPEDDPSNDLTEKLSYEPLWTFQDRFESYLPPQSQYCILVINGVLEMMNAKRDGRTIKKIDINEADEAAKELANIEEALWGNETPVTDALGLGLAVTDFHEKVGFGYLSVDSEDKKDGSIS